MDAKGDLPGFEERFAEARGCRLRYLVAGEGEPLVLVHGLGGDDIIVGDVPFSAHPGKDRLFGGTGRDYIDSYDGRRDLANGGPGRDRGMFDRHDRVRSIETRG